MAQVDAFLKLDGVKGGSIDSKHPDEIEILSWSWGVANSGSAQTSTGAGAGKASVADLTIMKLMDVSSPILVKNSVTGTHIANGLLTIRKAGGDSPLEYFKFKLQKVLISSYQVSGSDGNPDLTESVSFNFQKFDIVYTPQDNTGAAGAGVEFGYDIAANKSA
ncbi:MAG: type VI secretion system tube protein Hcp [Caulobacteraceae bacterium]|nr:type VI secretion system tube protein Hcp [Caulobacteraceae bacterium]